MWIPGLELSTVTLFGMPVYIGHRTGKLFTWYNRTLKSHRRILKLINSPYSYQHYQHLIHKTVIFCIVYALNVSSVILYTEPMLQAKTRKLQKRHLWDTMLFSTLWPLQCWYAVKPTKITIQTLGFSWKVFHLFSFFLI